MVSTDHLPSFNLGLTAITPFERPDTITRSPATSGVGMFCTYCVVNGIRQSNRPSSSDTPTTLLCVSVMTWRVPPKFATTGDEYPGPSPSHCHFTAPDSASNAVRAPWSLPPECMMTRPLSTSGDIAVPNNGEVSGKRLENSFCQRMAPVAAFQHVR